MAAVSRKRKRTALDIHQKQDIISYYDGTVGDIISHREKWLAANTSLPGPKRVKRAMHGDLEEALWL